MANAKAHLEWELLQVAEWVMEEINCRVIDNRLKDQPMSVHDAMVLEVERVNRIAGRRLSHRVPSRGYSDRLDGTLRGPPA
jgi:hypothetical protein